MGIFAALFSALSRRLGTLLQAVFGWSVMSMFGKLDSKKQLLITLAVVLSLCWPVFVLGIFEPKAVAFVIAFIPGGADISPAVLRAVWVGFAALSPVVVGLLTRVASPSLKAKGFFSAMLNGYPLTLGYALSFLITLFVVPVVKLQTLKRGWADEHVFVQTKNGCYLSAIEQLCDAAALAGFDPRAHAAPRAMGLALKVLKLFARGAIDSMVAEEPLVVRAQNIELFLYPGDLLLRGGKVEVARMRAMIGQTKLEKYAYLVEQPAAQELQDDLGGLFEAVDRHVDPREMGDVAKRRLEEIVRASAKAKLGFEEWLVLDRLARRVEARMNAHESLVDEAAVADGVSLLNPAPVKADEPAKSTTPLADASVLELVQRGIHDATALARLEVALAKREAEEQVKEASKGAIGFALAAALVIVTLSLGGMALVFALGATVKAALMVAGGALLLALVVGGVGYSLLPSKLLGRTRTHVKRDLKQLKEHLA
ncbi:MAG: phage holin family protein [Myxococcaceae bacterium]|nr:phage holin family protein [Myxococcaceae bacterium]